MDITGRIESLESQLAFISQELIRKPSLEVFSQYSSVWNQQFCGIDDKANATEAALNELQILYANLALDIDGAILDANQDVLFETFETINQNLKEYPYSLSYSTGSDLTGIRYTLSETGYIQKSLDYDLSGLLIKVSIAGDPLLSVTLSKNFLYTGEDMTGVYYS
jgi:hypothetical protein